MSNQQVVELGRLLGDPTRVALLDAMWDGRAYTVTELRKHVGVAASTASEQLSRLLDGGLVTTEPQGRFRYYRMASPEVAAMLESLWEFGGSPPVKRSSRVPADMVYARSCYDHLAGTVAVGLTDHFVANDVIEFFDMVPRVTQSGRRLFSSLELLPSNDEHRANASGRAEVRRCLDWSERRPHLAGLLPADLLGHMLSERWFVRRPNTRALQITDTGRAGLSSTFGYVAP